jgi:hypothetical protein
MVDPAPYCRCFAPQDAAMLAKLLTGFLFPALIALTPAGVDAVDVVNEDEETYELVISEGSMSRTLILEGWGTVDNVCEACTIEIDGVGEIDAIEDEVVVIKDGAAKIRD